VTNTTDLLRSHVSFVSSERDSGSNKKAKKEAPREPETLWSMEFRPSFEMEALREMVLDNIQGLNSQRKLEASSFHWL